LQTLPEPLQPLRFFQYWTLKESYIKARGMGLSIPLDRFSFDASQPTRITFSVDPILEDDAAHWTFWQWSLAEGYLLALCAQRRDASSSRFNQRCRAISVPPASDSSKPATGLKSVHRRFTAKWNMRKR
jgi:4'-phosphopantetheinyl transferase